MDLEPVSISFRYERLEYIQSVRRYLRMCGVIHRWDWAVLAAILAAVGWIIRLTGITPMVVVLLVLTAVVAAMAGIVYGWMPGRQFDHTPQLRECCTIHFSVEDIGIQRETAAGVVPWSCRKLWSSPSSYYLIQSRQNCIILPKRAFRSQADRLRFEEIAAAANPDAKWKEFH